MVRLVTSDASSPVKTMIVLGWEESRVGVLVAVGVVGGGVDFGVTARLRRDGVRGSTKVGLVLAGDFWFSFSLSTLLVLPDKGRS